MGDRLQPKSASNRSAASYGVFKYLAVARDIQKATGDNELVSLERKLRQDGTACAVADTTTTSVCFLASSRFFPIFGETAASFGAFLGRPLRELDFYIGAYDGLVRDIEARWCQPKRDGDSVSADCVYGELAKLLDPKCNRLPELSIVGRRLIAFLASEEARGGMMSEITRDMLTKATESLNPRERDLRRLLWSLRAAKATLDSSHSLRVAKPQRGSAERRVCPFANAIVGFFCKDGLTLALRNYAEIINTTGRAQREVKLKNAGATAAEYVSDTAFESLTKDPDRRLFLRGRQVLFRLRQLEGRDGKRGRAAAAVVELVAAKGEENVYGGLQLLTSVPSAPYLGGPAWLSRVGPFVQRRLVPLAVVFSSAAATRFQWAPVEAVVWRGHTFAGIASLGTTQQWRDLAIGMRYQSPKASEAWIWGVHNAALHVQPELCLDRRCPWRSSVEAQLVFWGRSVGVGARLVTPRAPHSAARMESVLSIQDLPALVHLAVSTLAK